MIDLASRTEVFPTLIPVIFTHSTSAVAARLPDNVRAGGRDVCGNLGQN